MATEPFETKELPAFFMEGERESQSVPRSGRNLIKVAEDLCKREPRQDAKLYGHWWIHQNWV